jgi:hypothetical protein
MVIVRADRADAPPHEEAGRPKNGRPELLDGMIALSLRWAPMRARSVVSSRTVGATI